MKLVQSVREHRPTRSSAAFFQGRVNGVITTDGHPAVNERRAYTVEIPATIRAKRGGSTT